MKRSSGDWSLLSAAYHDSLDELHLSAGCRHRILNACNKRDTMLYDRKLSRLSFIAGATAVLMGGIAVAARRPAGLLRLNVAHAANHNGGAPYPLVSDARGMALAGVSQGLTAYFKLNLGTNARAGTVEYLLSDVPTILYDYQTSPFTKPGVQFVGEAGELLENGLFEVCAEADDTTFLDHIYLAVGIDPLSFYASDDVLKLYWEYTDLRRAVCDLQGRGRHVDALGPDRMSREIEHELSMCLHDILADSHRCADWISGCYAAYVCNAAAVLAEMRLTVASGDERVTYEIFPALNLEENARAEMGAFIEDAYYGQLNEMQGASDNFWGIPFWDTVELLHAHGNTIQQADKALFYIREVERL